MLRGSAFIQRALAEGPQLAEVILKAAAAGDIAEGTLYYAKRALGVTSTHQSYHGRLRVGHAGRASSRARSFDAKA